MDGVDRLVFAAVTRRGRRLLTRAELLADGLTDKQIAGRVARGVWQEPYPGVYLIGAGALTWNERELAAVLASGDTAFASRRAALKLWTPDVVRFDATEISVAHTTEAVAGDFIHRTRRSTPMTVRSGIRCSGVEESLLDATTVLSEIIIERAFTDAWRRHLTTPKKLKLHIEQYGGRGIRGTPLIRDIANRYGEFDRPPGSVAETDLLPILLPALDVAGIEHPVVQFAVKDNCGREHYTADLGWKERHAVVEVEGLSAHGDARRQAEGIEREAAIKALGYRYHRVAPVSIRDRPEKTVRDIVRFLLGGSTALRGR